MSIDRIGAALDGDRRAVVSAPPGAGKTTIVPLALLDAAWRGDGRIVVLEPRRLATRAAARRMADLAGQRVGDLVGYQTQGRTARSAQRPVSRCSPRAC